MATKKDVEKVEETKEEVVKKEEVIKKAEVEEVKTTTDKVTYEDIQRANEKLKATDIKGKPYMEVNQRIKAFRMVYPTGYIHTEMASNTNGVCIFRTDVGYYDGEGNKIELATGTAYEKEGEGFINKTSYIENAETSCVGRALGMAGFGVDASVASAEEVQNAIIQQEQTEKEEKVNNEKVTEKDVNTLKAVLVKKGVHEQSLLDRYKVKSLSDLTFANFTSAMQILSKQEDKN